MPVVRTGQCIVSVGGFCPVESIAGTLLLTGVVAGAVFGLRLLFRSPSVSAQHSAPTDDMRIAECLSFITAQWRMFDRSPFHGITDTLAQKIERFVPAVREALFERFPFTQLLPPPRLLSTICMAVDQAGTHSPESVARAYAALLPMFVSQQKDIPDVW